MVLIPGQFVVNQAGQRLLNDLGQFYVHDPDGDPCCGEIEWACCVPGTDICYEALCVDCEAAGHICLPGHHCSDDGFDCGNRWACCLPDGTCIEATCAECERQGGEFNHGKHCDDPDFECPTGACCLPDGTCMDTTHTYCESQEGIWNGSHHCDDEDFSCTGACCYDLAEHLCMQTTPAGCDEIDGIFYGNGVACDNPGVICNAVGTCTGCVDGGENYTPQAVRVTFNCCNAAGSVGEHPPYEGCWALRTAIYPHTLIVPRLANCRYHRESAGVIIEENYCNGNYSATIHPLHICIRYTGSTVWVKLCVDVRDCFLSSDPPLELFQGHGVVEHCRDACVIQNEKEGCIEGTYPAPGSLGGGFATVVPIR